VVGSRSLFSYMNIRVFSSALMWTFNGTDEGYIAFCIADLKDDDGHFILLCLCIS